MLFGQVLMRKSLNNQGATLESLTEVMLDYDDGQSVDLHWLKTMTQMLLDQNQTGTDRLTGALGVLRIRVGSSLVLDLLQKHAGEMWDGGSYLKPYDPVLENSQVCVEWALDARDEAKDWDPVRKDCIT